MEVSVYSIVEHLGPIAGRDAEDAIEAIEAALQELRFEEETDYRIVLEVFKMPEGYVRLPTINDVE
jgi:hypothetical protein